MSEAMRLKDKVTVVTGALQGLGEHLSLELASEGAHESSWRRGMRRGSGRPRSDRAERRYGAGGARGRLGDQPRRHVDGIGHIENAVVVESAHVAEGIGA